MTSIGELRRRTLESLTRPTYSIARKDMILLNDNANLFGVNPAVEELARSFDFTRLWAYPSENSDELRERIASEFGFSSEEVIVGNGSDELLDITSKAFINPGDKFCQPAPTFSMYKFYATVNFAEVCEKVIRPDFALDPDALIDERAKLYAICQPNNPTANLFDTRAIKRVLSEAPGIVLVDEAYADFCGSNMMGPVMNSERGIVIRTFSKAHGLAGLRAGFAISSKAIVDELRRVRTPFGLNSFTEAAAMKALDNKEWINQTVSKVKSEREYLGSQLKKRGFTVYPSECNFLLCRPPVPGPALVAALRSEGVAIRDLNSFPLLENHVRITVAPRPMLDTLLDKIDHLIAGGSR